MAETVFWSPDMDDFQIPKITIFRQNDRPEEYVLRQVMKLGRGSAGTNPDIPLISRTASRNQGEFGIQGKNCYYRDTGSKNGTWINGSLWRQQNGTYKVSDGDIFSFYPSEPGGTGREEVLLYTEGDRAVRHGQIDIL